MTSNTGDNRKPGTFTKGDPRINRKGRPKSFDALRKLAQEIAHEEALSNGAPVVINGHIVTVAEAILRSWATSKNPQLVKSFIEIAFGKVPDKIELSGPDSGPIKVKAVDYRAIASALAPGSIPDSGAPGENKNTGYGPEMG